MLPGELAGGGPGLCAVALTKEGGELAQCSIPVRDGVLHCLGQLGVGLVVAIRLKAGIPAKISGASGLHYQPMSLAFEELHRFLWVSSTECEGTESIGRFVFKPSQQLVQAFRFEFFQKPFYVWSWKPPQGIEAQAGILYYNRSPNLQQKPKR